MSDLSEIAQLRAENADLRRRLEEARQTTRPGEDAPERNRAEEELRAARDTFRHLVDYSPFGIYAVNADFRLVQVSAGAQKVFENVRPLLGRDFAEVLRCIWPEPFATEAIGRFRHTLETGEPYRSPSTVERRQDIGQVESYDWKIDRVTLPDGRFGVVCHFYDLSQRQQYEAALRESEQRFRTMADTSPVMIWVTDPRGDIEFVNRSYLEFFGVNEGQVRRQGAWQPRVHPEDRVTYVERFMAAQRDRSPFAAECRVRHADGTWRWIASYAAPRFGESGEFLGHVGSSPDITQRKQIEEALQESRRFLENVVETSPALIVVTDEHGRLVLFNRACEELTGYRRHEVLGRTIAELFLAPEWLPVVAKRFADLDAPEVRAPHMNPWLTKSGEERSIEWRCMPLPREAGLPRRVLGAGIDITERKRAEQALRDADRRKDEFLATLSHELRNPLAPLMSALELLGYVGGSDPLAAEARETMRRQLSHMVRLVDDLLDVSRIARGKIKLKSERLDVGAIIRDAVEACEPLTRQLRHEMTIDVPAEPIWLDGDTVRLTQTIGNLINNACKYTPEGGRIRVTASREGSDAVVRVRDNGIGIPPENLDSIFEMFSQVDMAQHLAQGGLGIGLALVKRLVTMHGGSIEVRSEGPGRGSEFVVRLPRVVEDSVQTDVTPEQAADAAINGIPPPVAETLRPRILIVDDNRDSAVSLARLLMMSGNRTQTAFDGPEAIEIAKRFDPHVVLLDIGLPRMSGYDVCRKIRATLTSRQPLMIAVTGWGQEEDRRRSSEAGFDHHLVKPVDLEKLRVLLAQLAQLQEPAAVGGRVANS